MTKAEYLIKSLNQEIEAVAKLLNEIDQRIGKAKAILEYAAKSGVFDGLDEEVCEDCGSRCASTTIPLGGELREPDDLDLDCGCKVCGFEPCLCRSV